MSRSVPRLLFTAPASGSGKTTVACAVLQALVRRGMRPVAFKSGPDYIDPMFHTAAIGVPSRNLDLFLMGEAAVRRSLLENSSEQDVAILEGAMGYYDGIALSSQASAWDLACRTRTPAVLVVDGRGAARSLAALVKGFQALEPEHMLRGVILGRVSAMLYPRLKACIEAETGLTVYGYLPSMPQCSLESRHLGLVTAEEIPTLREKLSALAEQAERSLDLDGLLRLAWSAEPLTEEAAPQIAADTEKRRPVIGVARDEAFCFYYADALRFLEELGAELAFFSPMRDEALPEQCSGLYLGGGYPELHGAALTQNISMRRTIRSALQSGMPTVAECGGFLYLHEILTDGEGMDQPMAGAIPARAWDSGKLGRFGYMELTARLSGLLCETGETLTAHEFHYWESSAPGTAFHAQKPLSGRGWDCAWHTPTMYAGFPHFHFCGCPKAAARFVTACARYRTI
ncbi:cobyrinate a,c-diamide synthase [Pseudoflavonifractor sp. MSJ-37]|uniref:cobyrinate a,c-diamide synthase n=1 Tax=Pseudoflavonifractor sp. MSJ-37 TaxID=2841531 RepID=UPI001C123031|nr:cobyrinate a,c-diamide synthase [Pseudoflavonifractor sp. MSJ-37]MBU5434725.1 cobyrinate a,c-diamide synthase [Pseudoflavonifractor sp. MSJ-37]